MTEIEKIAYAKSYIDRLANGINPLDDTIIPKDDVVNNIKISRCLFYVSDILRQVVENNGISHQEKKKKLNFFLSAEQISALKASEMPLCISEITAYLNSLVNLEDYKKLKHSTITSWLVSIGVLNEIETPIGKRKHPTEQGTELGIFVENRMGIRGPYDVVLYNKNAQQFIFDNLDAILETQ